MARAIQQHVASCVKGVEWGFGTRGLRIGLGRYILLVASYDTQGIGGRILHFYSTSNKHFFGGFSKNIPGRYSREAAQKVSSQSNKESCTKVLLKKNKEILARNDDI